VETSASRVEQGPAFTFALSLHVKHPSMDPAEISRVLRIPAHCSTRVGEPRRRPNGQELGGLYPWSHWYCIVAHDATDRPGGAAFDCATLEKLASLHIGLTFEVYGDGESREGL